MDERDALDELFTTTLDAFVETRTRLAAALLAAGHKAEAQALKKVRRPSASAWATNQVVRRARAEVDGFLEASDRLRGSQGSIVAGRGDRGVYQADVEDLRRATAALAEAARRTLAELGRVDDRPLVDRVVANARVAALTDAGRQALLAGALLVDLDGGDDVFGGLLAAGAAGAATAAPARAPRAEPPRAAPAASARDEEARRRAEERARELEAARREEADARAALGGAEDAAARTRAALDDARRRREEAQEAAREAERAVADADAAHRGAQKDVALAETRAGRATRRREGLEK